MHSNFVDLLVDRIRLVRAKLVLNPKSQCSGLRYKSDDFAVDQILLTLEAINGDMDGSVPIEAIGLDFDDNLVLDGKFDPFIRFVLIQLSEIDYLLENRVDLH